MHILILTPVYPHTGELTEGMLHEEQARELARKGQRITMIVCKPWLPRGMAKMWRRYRPLAALPRRETRQGIPIYYARYFHLPGYRWPRLTVASCARSIWRTLLQFPPEEPFNLIQVHDLWPVGMAAPKIAARLARPFVLTLHIRDDPRLYSGGEGAGLYRRTLESASAVVTVGSPLQKFLKECLPELAKDRIQVIPNAFAFHDLKEMWTDVPPKRENGPHIISVGNLWPIKGIDLNLRALQRLEHLGVPWGRYTVVGDGPERRKLERLALELGISARVTFTGRLPHRETLQAMTQADIFSLPSWQEAFGMVYLEAMACGKPVIGCRGQGAEDIFRHGQEGLLVRPRDEIDLATTLRRLVEDRPLTRRMGQAGIARAREFSWERNAEAYLQVYRKVCSDDLPRIFREEAGEGSSKLGGNPGAEGIPQASLGLRQHNS